MDWVVGALKYAPEILGMARAATAWATGNGDADSTTQLAKSVVMIGVKELAGNCCESAVGSGATVLLGSGTFDVAASTATGRDYGMVKDLRNGDYLAAGASGLSDFSTGYSLYKGDDKKKKDGKKRKTGNGDKKKPIKPAEPPLGLPAPEYDGFPIFESIPEMEPRLEHVHGAPCKHVQRQICSTY